MRASWISSHVLDNSSGWDELFGSPPSIETLRALIRSLTSDVLLYSELKQKEGRGLTTLSTPPRSIRRYIETASSQMTHSSSTETLGILSVFSVTRVYSI
ncbi:hypothetical protein CHS0354_025216 [Potamilus streckersoni]|uniref:Uncharacterized protein n=1 Tax=Potamilus streckersoni TaxID=2493646 RepID=A0AAE0RN36_9BIVA|nr:hypothetical protein CHS0354_025216 [Potamilus streckersoni]